MLPVAFCEARQSLMGAARWPDRSTFESFGDEMLPAALWG
jgi:hypothetical protein